MTPQDKASLTAQQRADKILLETPCGKDREKNLANAIASQIEEAVQDATVDLFKMASEAQAEAYEDAAKIAETEPCSHCDVCPQMIGRMIRARAKEVGK